MLIKTYHHAVSTDFDEKGLFEEIPQYEKGINWDENLRFYEYYEYSPLRGGMPARIEILGRKISPWEIFEDAIKDLQRFVDVRSRQKKWIVPIRLQTGGLGTTFVFGLLSLKREKDHFNLRVHLQESNLYAEPHERAFIPVTGVKGKKLDGDFWRRSRLAMAVAFFGINFHYHIGELDF